MASPPLEPTPPAAQSPEQSPAQFPTPFPAQPTPPPPKPRSIQRPKQPALTQEQRIQCQTLRSIDWTYEAIARHLGFTQRQVQLACTREDTTPSARKGRSPAISTEQCDELETFIRTCRANRRMSFFQLATGPFRHYGAGEHAFKGAMERRGYRRYAARVKSVLSDENQRVRVEWARRHVEWGEERWGTVLWVDGMWLAGARQQKEWVTRREGEELNDTCLVDKVARKRGWFFCCSVKGLEKGPCFLSDEWSDFGGKTYNQAVVPLVEGVMREKPGMQLMLDGTPGSSISESTAELKKHGITPMTWPPTSPDLSVVAAVGDWLEEYIEDELGTEAQLSDKERFHPSKEMVRAVIYKAWEALPQDKVAEFVRSMRQRCEDVIRVGGAHTKW